jgi:tetratricopeptide (TPR) repeat protein
MSLLYATLWAGLWAPVQATGVAPHDLPCPLDGAAVRVFEKLSGNTHGGWDSDMARYASQGQWRRYAISTCQQDFLSLYGEDWEELSGTLVADSVREILAPYISTDPETLEIWDRYLIAADVYRSLGRDARFLGQLYLEASWTARDVAVGEYGGLEGPVMARQLLEAGAIELEKELPPTTRKILLHNLARVAHRGGFNRERNAYLDAFEAVGDFSAPETRVLRRFQQIVEEVEPALQDRAITEFERWLEEHPEPSPEAMRLNYVLADLHRRRGHPEQAARGYARVLASEHSTQEIKDLSAFLKDEMQSP